MRGSQIYHLHGAFPNARASILCEVTRGPHRPDGQLERSDNNAFPTVLHRIHEGNRLPLYSLKKKITFQRMSADPGMVAWWHTPGNPALGFHHLERRWKSGVNDLN